MPRKAERRESDSRYSLRFGATALALITGTLVLVLYVLPERYVLRPGFRESGTSFPAPSTPFAPLPAVAVAARVLPAPSPVILPGPAELFWAAVVPLLERSQYPAALPVFDAYLLAHPEDADARRERAVALLAAGRRDEAVEELRRLLAMHDDDAQRLLLARTLRELGRTDEAAAEYGRLAETRPDDVLLALERAQAYAWVRRYEEAARVLRLALARDPSSIPLRVELARVLYSGGRLRDAEAQLAGLDEDALRSAGALSLSGDILTALFVPEPVPPPPPTLLERAVAAREARDLPRARELLEQALRESAEDPAVVKAYADLLEYELGDLEGAYAALLEAERLRAWDANLQYRLAQLEIWTGRTGEAGLRLQELLARLDGGAEGSAVSHADVQATLGDLLRWEGDRPGAAERYGLALENDPANARANAGLEALQAEVGGMTVELEAPRIGGSAYSLADTDDFARVDVGGEWVEVGGPWAWSGTVGSRWIAGVALDGAERLRQGAYFDLEAARWWRWGTVRTALDFGAERLRTAWDVSLGATIRHRGHDGSNTELRYERGPAYPIAVTLQSVLARVVHDRIVFSHARPLGERSSLAATLEGAWLGADPDSVGSGTAPGTGRVQAALSIGRALSGSFTLGLTARSLVFTRAAPFASSQGGATRLFWDPSLVLTAAPYARLTRDLSESWKVAATIGAGVAIIDERGPGGPDWVPQASAEAGVRREVGLYWAALDGFYSQGQFDGYRTYGARLSVNLRDFSALRASP